MRDGWVETSLGQYIQINTGKLDVNAASEFGEYPFFTCSRETYRINEAAFEGESVLVAGNGDLNVKYYDGEFNAYQRTYVLNSVDKKILDNRFLFLYMQTYIEYLRSETRGTVIQYLKKGQFTDAKIKLPPLPEQKRIVDLISSVDSYIQALHQQLKNAKRSRKAVLHDLFTANDSWPEIGLEDLESSGVIKLGRGDVISKKDMEADPGPNPVYSSAENKNGMIGQYAKFMFDEELITWSIDGGGHIFYRPKHKFSVTNIGGWLRILDNSIFSYKFLTFALQRLHTQHHFDWQSKAHPSVLRTLYTRIPSPPLAEQSRIVGIISAIDEQIEQSNNAVRVARDLRSGLLSDLLDGDHEIPASYDKVMGAA